MEEPRLISMVFINISGNLLENVKFFSHEARQRIAANKEIKAETAHYLNFAAEFNTKGNNNFDYFGSIPKNLAIKMLSNNNMFDIIIDEFPIGSQITLYFKEKDLLKSKRYTESI